MVLVNFLYLTRIKMGSEQMGGALIDLSSDSIIFPSTFKHFTAERYKFPLHTHTHKIIKHMSGYTDLHSFTSSSWIPGLKVQIHLDWEHMGLTCCPCIMTAELRSLWPGKNPAKIFFSFLPSFLSFCLSVRPSVLEVGSEDNGRKGNGKIPLLTQKP